MELGKLGVLLVGVLMSVWSMFGFKKWFKYNPEKSKAELENIEEEILEDGFNPTTIAASAYVMYAIVAIIEGVYLFHTANYMGMTWIQLVAALIITWKIFATATSRKRIVSMKWESLSGGIRVMSFLFKLLFVLYNLYFIYYLVTMKG
jgi:hypothetical protein